MIVLNIVVYLVILAATLRLTWWFIIKSIEAFRSVFGRQQ